MRVFGSLFFITLLLAIAAAALAFYGHQEFTLPGPLTEKTVFNVEKGLSTPQIAVKLEDAGIITDARVFSAAAWLTGGRGRLKAGEYEFDAAIPMRDVMDLLVSGKSITYKLSVPEGWTSEMALARIAENAILTGEVTVPPLEGAIMPDTYVFRRGMTRQKLVEDMQSAQVKLLDEIWAKRKGGLPIRTKEEAVILASIVEKETGVASERPLIASVFMNRLTRGMRLQSDPTIIYGIVGGKGKLDRALTKADITTPTPYNTYTINGLPPGPIANPGRAALEAVVNPPETSYLYFVADGSGGHAFASTLEEHNRNVARWRDLEGNAASAAAAEAAPEAAAEDAAAAPKAEPVPEPQAATLPDIETEAAAPLPAPADAAAEKPAETPAEKPAAETAAVPEPEAVVEAEAAPQPPAADLKPGSVIEVDGTLVAIPRRKPKR